MIDQDRQPLLADYSEESVRQWREDALRYRWLRAQEGYGCWPQAVDGLRRLVGDALDAAIDEAMHSCGQGVLPPPAVRSGLHLNA